MSANSLLPLAWDSDFLGYGVARLPLDHLDAATLQARVAEATAAGLRLLYLVAAPDDALSNAAALQAGATLVDRKVTFGMAVAADEAAQLVPAAIRATTTLTEQLERLALQSGEYSRYRLDANFAPDVYAQLYGIWLRNSLSGSIAREVLVYESAPDAPALGLLTLGLKNSRADIGLLAVDAASRGLGVGQQLVQVARQRTAAWGLAELQVVTQLDNAPACSFYRKCGFTEWQVEHIYHLWLPAR